MDPFCNQGSFFPSTFSLSFLFSLSRPLHRARFLLCIRGQIAWDAVTALKMPIWHLQVTVGHIVFKVEMYSWYCKLTFITNQQNPARSKNWHTNMNLSWAKLYRKHEREQKFHTTHSSSPIDLEWVGTFGSSGMLSWIISSMCLCLQMKNELLWGYWVWHAIFCIQGGWYQLYLVLWWWGCWIRWWRKPDAQSHVLDCCLEMTCPFQEAWNLNTTGNKEEQKTTGCQ